MTSAIILAQSGFDITVSFDNAYPQVIHYVPDADPAVSAAQSLSSFLSKYAAAYKEGLAKASPPSLDVMLNQTMEL